MAITDKKIFPINNPQNPAIGIFLKDIENFHGSSENKSILNIEPFVFSGALIDSVFIDFDSDIFYVGLECIFGGDNIELLNIVPDVHLNDNADNLKMHLSNVSAHEEAPPPNPNSKLLANYIKVQNVSFYRLVFVGYDTFQFIGFKVTLLP